MAEDLTTKLTRGLQDYLELYKETGNLVFHGPSTNIPEGEYKVFDRDKLEKRQREIAIDSIVSSLDIPVSDRNIAEQAFDKFQNEYESDQHSRMSELRQKLWKWKVFEYVRVEIAKRDNPEMIPHIQAVAIDEQKRITSLMVAERLNPAKEPALDFNKMMEDAEIKLFLDKQHSSRLVTAKEHLIKKIRERLL